MPSWCAHTPAHATIAAEALAPTPNPAARVVGAAAVLPGAAAGAAVAAAVVTARLPQTPRVGGGPRLPRRRRASGRRAHEGRGSAALHPAATATAAACSSAAAAATTVAAVLSPLASGVFSHSGFLLANARRWGEGGRGGWEGGGGRAGALVEERKQSELGPPTCGCHPRGTSAAASHSPPSHCPSPSPPSVHQPAWLHPLQRPFHTTARRKNYLGTGGRMGGGSLHHPPHRFPPTPCLNATPLPPLAPRVSLTKSPPAPPPRRSAAAVAPPASSPRGGQTPP